MLAVAFGASGSGKSTLAPLLRERLPGVAVHDFDEAGGDPPWDLAWRRRATEAWLARARRDEARGRDLLLLGGVAGEVLASPSATEVDGCAFCLLDCANEERMRRLTARERGRPMDAHELWDHVAWGVWLRFHALDPQWFLGPLVGSDDGGLRWERFAGWRRGDPRWRIERLDTTAEPPEVSASRVEDGLRARQLERDENRLALAGAWWQDAGSAA